ncbi:MAG: cytochrome b N-terminal domain-containing protein [Chloroflexota bacterium]
MKPTPPQERPPSIFERMRKTLALSGMPTDDRGRMRMVMNNLILHIHPTKVNVRTLRFTYTWGLGGLSAILLVFLVLTGVLLEMNYTPRPPQAYLDILNLRTNVWFGDLIRSLHHWSGNLLLGAAVLHLLRVFFTGGHRPPRELNWLIGVAMLLLIVGANFTGYLLPWDQLAFWAITVGTSIVEYVPLVGSAISRLLLGGPEVGAPTLLYFYALHISVIPVSVVMLMSYHFWRIRKDGGLTIPKAPGEELPSQAEKVTTIPHLVNKELVFALVWMAILLVWAIFIPAPLEGIANPAVSPNPAKAPWYFMGIQELLLHFHPLVGAIIIPGIALIALALLPFYDVTTPSVGVYFRSRRGRYLALFAVGLGLLATPIWVLLDEFVLHWTVWLSTWPTLLSNGLIPFAIILLGLLSLDEFVQKTLHATQEERVLTLFIFLFTALIVLTIIGIFFRGPGMSLYWPWEMPVHV